MHPTDEAFRLIDNTGTRPVFDRLVATQQLPKLPKYMRLGVKLPRKLKKKMKNVIWAAACGQIMAVQVAGLILAHMSSPSPARAIFPVTQVL